MSRSRLSVLLLALALVLSVVGCDGGGEAGPAPADEPSSDFKIDSDATVELAVTADGGGAGVATGDAYAAVYVPPGAATDGATWEIIPLTVAPEGVEYPLCPGVYVDTAGEDPTGWCSIGFSLPGEASPNATIVRLAEDGTVAEVVATSRMDYGGRTFLTAYVQGFSPYTTAEEDQAARDAAWVEQAQAKGQMPDWTIKVVGSESQDISGWSFVYELDMFASGGGIGQGGTYTGHAMMNVVGEYKDTSAVPYYQTSGSINAIGRDQALTFTMIDPPLASLLTGAGGDMPFAEGVMNLEGMGDLSITAQGAQGEKGQVGEDDIQSTDPVEFTLKVTTFEDVQVEIADVGIFPGKILRTAK
ncbi:MAG: hypothetical protein ACYC2X_01770 [Coriobacteriia bacterium]